MGFFGKTNRNRRLGRRQVLDVKVRADVVRAARLRWAATAVGVLFGTALGLLLLWSAGEWAVRHFLTGNDAFAIQQIDVRTDGDLAADQIRRWAGVSAGQNLLALDLSRVKRDLELEPQIKTATVERVLPRQLRIRVIEREPLAQIHVPRPRANGTVELAVLYLDEDACVMPPLEPRQRATPPAQPPPSFPVITGLDLANLVPGRKLDAPQLRSALQLITAFDRSPMVGLDDLRQIDVSAPETLLIRSAQGGEVTFAVGDFDHQLRRWRQIYDVGQRMQRTIASLDLAVSNNIPARWREASVQPPVTTRPARTHRPRNHNV